MPRFVVENSPKRDWRELAQLAVAEHDSQKLIKLITELNAALSEQRRALDVNSRSKRVLVVDDDPIVPKTLVPVLKQRGFDVDIAATVAEALRVIDEHQLDVLICDLNIADARDGFTVATAMRKAQPTSVIVLLTGYPGFETAVEGIRRQVDDYFVKPADYGALISALEKRLASKQRL
ncbi:MAG TPA: response regulator [Candidatus Sulfotelmatobacter sp.]|nr:response regulator [Candidatus Sulfotelmatobacter sp.]